MPNRRKSQPSLGKVITQLQREWGMLSPSEQRAVKVSFTILTALAFVSVAL